MLRCWYKLSCFVLAVEVVSTFIEPFENDPDDKTVVWSCFHHICYAMTQVVKVCELYFFNNIRRIKGKIVLSYAPTKLVVLTMSHLKIKKKFAYTHVAGWCTLHNFANWNNFFFVVGIISYRIETCADSRMPYLCFLNNVLRKNVPLCFIPTCGVGRNCL